MVWWCTSSRPAAGARRPLNIEELLPLYNEDEYREESSSSATSQRAAVLRAGTALTSRDRAPLHVSAKANPDEVPQGARPAPPSRPAASNVRQPTVTAHCCAGGHLRTPWIGLGMGRGKIIEPKPSPPPTSQPRPWTNSRRVAAATWASNMSFGPGARSPR
jgi:hypothetical protein